MLVSTGFHWRQCYIFYRNTTYPGSLIRGSAEQSHAAWALTLLAIHDSVPGEACIIEEVGEPIGGGPEAQPLGIIVLGEASVDFL